MRALHDLSASLKRDGVLIDGVGLQAHSSPAGGQRT
jgi:GH35 family endo-1,4-beta-xylanase